MAQLYIKCIDEALNRFTYPAQVADLSYDLSPSFNGMAITLYGYHENAETLFNLIAERLKNCRPTEGHFKVYKDSLLRHYNNFNQESALQHGLESYKHIIKESHSTSPQRLRALEEIDYKTFIDYLEHLFDQTFIQGLFYGNVSEEQTLNVCQKLQKTLSSEVYPENERKIDRMILLREEAGPYLIDFTIDSPSHAALLAIEGPVFTFKARAAQQILGQAMNSAFFSLLRTRQQTGYLVFSMAEEMNRRLFNFFAVQSASHDPRDLISRFELFIRRVFARYANQ